MLFESSHPVNANALTLPSVLVHQSTYYAGGAIVVCILFSIAVFFFVRHCLRISNTVKNQQEPPSVSVVHIQPPPQPHQPQNTNYPPNSTQHFPFAQQPAQNPNVQPYPYNNNNNSVYHPPSVTVPAPAPFPPPPHNGHYNSTMNDMEMAANYDEPTIAASQPTPEEQAAQLVESLPTIKPLEKHCKENCPICLGALIDEEFKAGACLHMFHTECLQEFLQSRAQKGLDFTCPVCRKPLGVSRDEEQMARDTLSPSAPPLGT